MEQTYFAQKIFLLPKFPSIFMFSEVFMNFLIFATCCFMLLLLYVADTINFVANTQAFAPAWLAETCILFCVLVITCW